MYRTRPIHKIDITAFNDILDSDLFRNPTNDESNTILYKTILYYP